MSEWMEEFTVKEKSGGMCLIEIWSTLFHPFWLLHSQNFCSCPRSLDDDTVLWEVKKLLVDG